MNILSVKKIYLFLLFTFSVFGSVFSQQKPKSNYPYLLYLPEDYSVSEKSYPLIIYLGGGSQNGNDLNKLKSYGIPYCVEQGRQYDCIMASPQCPEGKYWTTENWFDSLYTDLFSKYRIDTTRIYVTGISNGGYGTWHIAMDYPDKFAAIAPLCGGVNDKDTANICLLKHLPVWTFHGTADDLIPIGETERVVKKLTPFGNVKFTRLPNEGHGIQYLYEDNTIFDWLLQHRKTIYANYTLNSFESTNYAKQIDSLLSVETSKPFNGVILAAKDGEVTYSKACGYSDLDKKIPLKIDDQFSVGSISKQFTATIVLQEYDKGHLDIYSPIKKYLPYLPESWADTVTIHHLLTHTHGIAALDKPTQFAAGTQFAYSQIGYDLLAKIVEKTSGKSFIELSDELFKECGMYHTFHPDLKEYKNLAKGYIENNKGKLEYTNETFSKYPNGKAFVGLEAYPAAGMFVSTAGDLALWSNNLFGGKLLKENTLQLMTTKQDKAIKKSPVFGFAEYGYGVIVNDEDEILQWTQTGYSPGFVSLTAYFPKNKRSIIILENVNYDVDDTKKTFYYPAVILNIIKKNTSKQL